jgi:hypothetical protein
MGTGKCFFRSESDHSHPLVLKIISGALPPCILICTSAFGSFQIEVWRDEYSRTMTTPSKMWRQRWCYTERGTAKIWPTITTLLGQVLGYRRGYFKVNPREAESNLWRDIWQLEWLQTVFNFTCVAISRLSAPPTHTHTHIKESACQIM